MSTKSIQWSITEHEMLRIAYIKRKHFIMYIICIIAGKSIRIGITQLFSIQRNLCVACGITLLHRGSPFPCVARVFARVSVAVYIEIVFSVLYGMSVDSKIQP